MVINPRKYKGKGDVHPPPPSPVERWGYEFARTSEG